MDMNINDYLKQISDQTRLRSLLLLHEEGELCVCELTYALGLSQPKVSRHLGVLRDMGIVRGRREGLWIYYSLRDGLPQWAMSILKSASQGTKGVEPFASDRSSICSMPNRPGADCCA